MAKDKLTEYDATANNNTVCGDVNLAENSALPSDMNNAVREIMSHQKEAFGAGTPLYVDQTNNRVGINKTPTVALDVNGETNLSSHLNMGDGDIIKLGASADLQIYHDGNSRITDVGGGKLQIETDGTDIALQKGATEYMARFFTDGAVDLYHNNALKFSTATTGVNVTGGIGLGGTGTANILDDYEEGTWTPAISGGSLSFTAITEARYTKIGRIVVINLYVDVDNVTNSANLVFNGLPFASSSYTGTGIVNLASNSTGGTVLVRVESGQTHCSFYRSNVNQTNVTQTQITGHLIFSMTYNTNA